MASLSEPLPARLNPDSLEAGCDEAGRGCIAGPVVAAAVILPPDFTHPLLNDSKQLTEKRRTMMRDVIKSNAIAWAIAEVSAGEIDRINILNASILAMHRALDGLQVRPESIVVDGNRFKPYNGIPYQTIVKGDGRIGCIAAASILAKTYRDELMTRLHHEHPAYCWDRNKGYPSPEHRAAIAAHGPCELHRLSFRLLPEPTLDL